MRSLFMLTCVFSSIVISCTSSSEKLVWSDEFNGSDQLDTTYWNYELGDGCPNCGWGNNEKQTYTDQSDNVRIENGILIVEAIKLDSQWTSARITTQRKINFTYGRIEFKAKLPIGTGTWPALWLLGENIASSGWPACGEIDVMEFAGRNPEVVQSALHSPGSYGNTINVKENPGNNFDSEFHIYEANWAENEIEFYVDGRNFYTYRPEIKDKDTWPYNRPFFILINLAMGGTFGGPIDTDLKRAQMEVDYVRWYR